MKTVYEIGDRVRTMNGTRSNPVWAYGHIAAIVTEEDGNILYRIKWEGEGKCYDYLYDFEIEPAT